MLADIGVNSPLYDCIEGVLIEQVRSGSVAERTGVREGDVITAANRVRVTSMDDLGQVLGRGDRTLLLRLQRGSSAVLLVVP